ncbi:hypothetical protein J5N97_023621 [Dioscorea zingiberensis]|uniref:Uncharacterized protein n=1 Tax=Dioscorea zingiberensis TaxID=325984 RepID=A0A9D5C612_9LILI|nr:hypothetical protein J5N97_023621 [Dioscorea zingiberensis]
MTSTSTLYPRRPIKPKRDKQHQHPFEDQDRDQDQPRRQWDFRLSTVVSPPAAPHAISDALGTIEFDPTRRVLATAGIARKIRIFNVSSMLQDHEEIDGQTRFLDQGACCEFYICTPAKLSSVRFRPEAAGRVIGAGDYDGVVTEYDLEKRVAVFERDEHGGRRVWSLAYSHCAPTLCASGSDDGTAQLWDTRAGVATCAGVVRPGERGEAVCSVEFEPGGGHGVGVGCADRGAYVYDARAVGAGPVVALRGHGRAVTYVRFVGDDKVVTSAADGSHRLWAAAEGKEVRVYRGHENGRSFVGMEVWRGGGLIGSGSESDEVYVYDLRWGEPVWVEGFGSQGGFVSCVSWREEDEGGGEEGVLVAGGTDGVVKLFQGRRKGVDEEEIVEQWEG